MITITITPATKGRFAVLADGRYLCDSSSPILDGARILAAQGIDPATPVALRNAGTDDITLSTIGALAGQVEDLVL